MAVVRTAQRAVLLVATIALTVGGAAAQPAPERATSTRGAPSGQQDPGGTDQPPADGVATKPKPSVTAGHSWTDKPRKRRRSKRRMRFDPHAPRVTFPGFRVLPDGRSLIWVVVSRKVPIEVERGQRRVTYVLKEAVIRGRNNTHPLVTTHFNTPVARMRLVPNRRGAQVVVQLREASEPTHQLIDGPRGSMLLQVILPRASRRYAAPSWLDPSPAPRTEPPSMRTPATKPSAGAGPQL